MPKSNALLRGIRASGPKRSAVFSFTRDRNGVAAVEFALLLLPFLMLVFAITETALVFVAETSLEQGVEDVARRIRTGQIRSASMDAEQFRSEFCKDVNFILDCSRLKIDVRPYGQFGDIVYYPSENPGGHPDYSQFVFDTGASKSIVAMRAFYPWPLHLDVIRKAMGDSDGNFILSSIAAFIVEGSH